jgi:hypothetical protein
MQVKERKERKERKEGSAADRSMLDTPILSIQSQKHYRNRAGSEIGRFNTSFELNNNKQKVR